MLLNNIKQLLIILSFSLAPLFWVPVIGKLLYLKALLTILLLFFVVRYWGTSINNLLCFLICFLFITVSSFINNSSMNEYILLSYKFITAMVFFILGKHVILTKHIAKKTYVIYFFYCLLIIVILLLKIPIHIPENWYYEQYPFASYVPNLNVTGWGFGRTQWSTCLSCFFPLIVFFINKKKTIGNKVILLILFAIPFITQLISGGRGGICATLIIISILLMIFNKNKIFSIIMLLLLFSIVLSVIYSFVDFFRINSQSITAYRYEQYQIIPTLLKEVSFFGIGRESLLYFMHVYDFEFSIHNSIIKLIVEYGIGGIISWLFIVYIFYVSLKQTFLSKYIDTSFYYKNMTFFFIILSGVICAFFEPNPIVSSEYWTLWWFAAGYFFNKDLNEKVKKTY